MQVDHWLQKDSVKQRAWTRELLRRFPDPPRPVRARELVRHFLWRTISVGVFFGLVAFVTGIWSFSWRGDNTFLKIAIPVFLFGTAAAFCFVLPILGWRRFARAIRRGVLASAEVVEVEFFSEASGDVPWDEVTAEGKMRIDQPHRPFEHEFSFIEPWAPELRPGIRMPVLVDPKAPRVLFELGLEDASQLGARRTTAATAAGSPRA